MGPRSASPTSKGARGPPRWSTSCGGRPEMAIPRFWREIQSRYNLVGTQCGNCGTLDFPPRDVCPKCGR
ncbi:MAG: Zn-ribbon domain-containing OB-fold protein, partial [Thermoplasmata archaeon]